MSSARGASGLSETNNFVRSNEVMYAKNISESTRSCTSDHENPHLDAQQSLRKQNNAPASQGGAHTTDTERPGAPRDEAEVVQTTLIKVVSEDGRLRSAHDIVV